MAAVEVKSNRATGDSYLDLVMRFPLKPVKTNAEHKRAMVVVNSLAGRNMDRGSSDYLDVLLDLVSKYEDRYEPIGNFTTPQEALLALMAANNLTQAAIGKIIGSESSVSMFLKGQRELSKKHIKAIADRFKMDAAIFL